MSNWKNILPANYLETQPGMILGVNTEEREKEGQRCILKTLILYIKILQTTNADLNSSSSAGRPPSTAPARPVAWRAAR